MTEKLLETMRSRGCRITKSRRAVIQILNSLDHPAPVEEIIGLMGDDAPDLATVYRNIDALNRLGLVHKVDLGEGFIRWELARTQEHHHLICTGCGRVTCIDFCSIAPMIKLASEKMGFRVDNHRVELTGLCAKCRKNKEQPKGKNRE